MCSSPKPPPPAAPPIPPAPMQIAPVVGDPVRKSQSQSLSTKKKGRQNLRTDLQIGGLNGGQGLNTPNG